MADYEEIERPAGKHCVCTVTGELISIDHQAKTGVVQTDDWGEIDVEIHYHCPGETDIQPGHNAFAEGDVVIVTAIIEEGHSTPNWPKITGFITGPRPCGGPGVHLFGGFISGEYGKARPSWWRCDLAVAPLFEGHCNDSFSLVYSKPGIPDYFWPFADMYNAAILCAPTFVADMELDEWELLRGPIYADIASLDGIAITTGCRLELYCGPNYTNHLITLNGPGVWYTDGWNWDGRGGAVYGFPDGDLGNIPEDCILAHWTADAQAAMGTPQALPHRPNGYIWGTGSGGTPPIRSLKVVDTRGS